MIDKIMLEGLLQLCNAKLDFFADSLQIYEKAAKENLHVDYKIELHKYGYAKSQVSDIKRLIEKFLNDKRSVSVGEKSTSEIEEVRDAISKAILNKDFFRKDDS